jgi:hypothetical protein
MKIPDRFAHALERNFMRMFRLSGRVASLWMKPERLPGIFACVSEQDRLEMAWIFKWRSLNHIEPAIRLDYQVLLEKWCQLITAEEAQHGQEVD